MKFSDVVYPVNCKHGAPMGRADIGDEYLKGEALTLTQLSLTDDYDAGGAYWGQTHDGLYVAFGQAFENGEDYEIVRFIRARSWHDARDKIADELPGVIVQQFGPDLPEFDDDARAMMIEGYLEAANWLASGDNGESLDSFEFSDEARKTARQHVDQFIKSISDLPGIDALDPNLLGYDLWLDRNDTGLGSEYRDYGDTGDALRKAARAMGGCYVYLNDNDELELN